MTNVIILSRKQKRVNRNWKIRVNGKFVGMTGLYTKVGFFLGNMIVDLLVDFEYDFFNVTIRNGKNIYEVSAYSK